MPHAPPPTPCKPAALSVPVTKPKTSWLLGDPEAIKAARERGD